MFRVNFRVATKDNIAAQTAKFRGRLRARLYDWGLDTLLASVRRLEKSVTVDGTPMAPLSEPWAWYKSFHGLRPNIGQATGAMLSYVRSAQIVIKDLGRSGVVAQVTLMGNRALEARMRGFQDGFTTSVQSLRQQRKLEFMFGLRSFPFGIGPFGIGTVLHHPARRFWGRSDDADKKLPDRIMKALFK